LASQRAAVGVVSLWGPTVAQRIEESVPGVRVVAADDHAGAASAEVLFGRWAPEPSFQQALGAAVRWVHVAASGVDAFDPAVAAGRTFTCSKGLVAGPISEFVMAAMLAHEKRIPQVWVDGPAPMGSIPLGTLRGRTLGIIGLGEVGRALARKAAAFDMEVLATRRRPEPEPGVRSVELTELLERSDHVVVAAALTDDTVGMLDDRAFEQLRPGAHLVNISRGAIVDQDALRRALDRDQLAAASLDVTDPEPLPEDHWMWHHPRVRISPHVSWSGGDTERAAVDRFVENLRRYLAGDELLGVVDPARWY